MEQWGKFVCIAVLILAIKLPWTFTFAVDPQPTPQVTELARSTLLATYTLSAGGSRLQCYIDHNCNIDQAIQFVQTIINALKALCEMNKPSTDLMPIIMNAGLAGMNEILAADPTCTTGMIKIPGSCNTAIVEPTAKNIQKCCVPKDLQTILNNFPDLWPLVDCLGAEWQDQAGEVIIKEITKAVCKKHHYDAIQYLAKASTNIVNQLRGMGKGICKFASKESACESLED